MAHASWAVAGWFTYGGGPVYWVVVVVGVFRSDLSCKISVEVSVVVDGGA
jgi:hypothetical protein